MNNRFNFKCGISIELDNNNIKVNTYTGGHPKTEKDIYNILLTYKIYRKNELIYTVWYDSGSQWKAMSEFSPENFSNELYSISYQFLDTKWIFTKLYNDHFAISLEEYEDNIAVIMTTSDELYNFLDFLKTTYKKIISQATL